MSYDKAIVTVRCDHEGVVSQLRDLVSTLNTPGSFLVSINDVSFYTKGSGVDGSKSVIVEVDEYSGEIPLFTEKVRGSLTGAEIVDVDIEQGASEVER